MTSYKLAQNCSIIIITVTADNLQDLKLINVVYFFCSDLFLFSRKLAKTVQDAITARKWRTLSAPSNNTSSLFFNLYICVRSINKLFKPQTRISGLFLNLRCVFKN